MFRAVRRSSSGAPIVFAASGLHTAIGYYPIAVCKPEAANTVGSPDDERHIARNMLSF